MSQTNWALPQPKRIRIFGARAINSDQRVCLIEFCSRNSCCLAYIINTNADLFYLTHFFFVFGQINKQKMNQSAAISSKKPSTAIRRPCKAAPPPAMLSFKEATQFKSTPFFTLSTAILVATLMLLKRRRKLLMARRKQR